MSDKVKLYRNKERNTPEPLRNEGYVPQYAQMGIEPIMHGGKSVAGKPMIIGSGGEHTLPPDNPRAPRPAFRQPYAEIPAKPLGRGKGLLPNVGNNVEQTWAVVDGQVIDDVGLDDQPMIDNNEFVSDQALGLSRRSFISNDEELEQSSRMVRNQSTDDITEVTPFDQILTATENGQLGNNDIFRELEDEEYLVLIAGEPICSGPLEDIQGQVSSLVFGDHPMCQGEPVDIEQLVVVKKVKIQVGVFLKA